MFEAWDQKWSIHHVSLQAFRDSDPWTHNKLSPCKQHITETTFNQLGMVYLQNFDSFSLTTCCWTSSLDFAGRV